MILYGYSKEKFCLGDSWELKAEPRSCVTSQSSILIRFAIRTTLNIRRKRSKGLGGGGEGIGEFLRTLLRGVGALAYSHVVVA